MHWNEIIPMVLYTLKPYTLSYAFEDFNPLLTRKSWQPWGRKTTGWVVGGRWKGHTSVSCLRKRWGMAAPCKCKKKKKKKERPKCPEKSALKGQSAGRVHRADKGHGGEEQNEHNETQQSMQKHTRKDSLTSLLPALRMLEWAERGKSFRNEVEVFKLPLTHALWCAQTKIPKFSHNGPPKETN